MPRLSFSRPGLTGMIDSDSDDAQSVAQSMAMSPVLGSENIVPAKKTRGRPKGSASKVTKAAKSPVKKGRRPALKDMTNAQVAVSDLDNAEDVEGHDDTTTTINETMEQMNDLDASSITIQEVVKPRVTKAKAPAKTTKAARGAPAKTDEINVMSNVPKLVPKARSANKMKRLREEEPDVLKEIQETQEPPKDLEDEDVDASTPMPVIPQSKLSRSSAPMRQPSLGRPKIENVPVVERSDPAEHRNAGDLAKQLESLEEKYRNLREVGIVEADRVFDKYKQQAEESAKISNGLIAKLKAEVAAQTSQSKETRSLKRRLEEQEEEMSDLQAKLSRANTNYKAELAAQSAQVKETRTLKRKLEEQDDEISELQRKLARIIKSRSEEHDDEVSALQSKLAQVNKSLAKAQAENQTLLGLQSKLDQVSKSLTDAQAENKTLSTKLAAARAAAALVESGNTRVPGSTKKNSAANRTIGSTEAAMAAKTAQLKEDLYSDLTGLIIRNVKREEEEDLFDCIQTGRNGTLHFKFSVPNENSTDYDDAQCQYVPQLDPSRDEELKDILPDYLTEEVLFPRVQVDKFYTRVFKALTDKLM